MQVGERDTARERAPENIPNLNKEDRDYIKY
jgi:hypothetical protein